MINGLKLTSKYTLLACSLILLGCSSTALQSPKEKNVSAFVSETQAKQQLAQLASCCDTLKQLQYEPLNNDKTQYVSFDKEADVFNFDSGKSFYKAYRLNENISELSVTVSGLFYNTVYAPQILLLDSQFNPTRLISADKLAYKEAYLLNGDELTASFLIKRPNLNNPANETYFIIYSTEKAMSAQTTITHPAKLDARARSNVEPSIDDPIINHSAMGVVKLTFDLVNKSDAYIAPEQQKKQPLKTEKVLSEIQYNTLITAALTENKIEEALQLVEQAEAAGSTSARSTFVEIIKK
jgi:maltose operon protein